MNEGLFWMLVALLVGAPGFIGAYLVFAPYDSLVVRYQNYRLARTHKPLKDEHFPDIKTKVLKLKVTGSILAIGSMAILFCLFWYSNALSRF